MMKNAKSLGGDALTRAQLPQRACKSASLRRPNLPPGAPASVTRTGIMRPSSHPAIKQIHYLAIACNSIEYIYIQSSLVAKGFSQVLAHLNPMQRLARCSWKLGAFACLDFRACLRMGFLLAKQHLASAVSRACVKHVFVGEMPPTMPLSIQRLHEITVRQCKTV